MLGSQPDRVISNVNSLDLGFGSNDHHQPTQDDEYAALAEKYGVTFDDDEEDESED
jgi:hypothetical protein